MQAFKSLGLIIIGRVEQVTYKGLIRTTEESLSQMASSSTSLTCLAVVKLRVCFI